MDINEIGQALAERDLAMQDYCSGIGFSGRDGQERLRVIIRHAKDALSEYRKLKEHKT